MTYRIPGFDYLVNLGVRALPGISANVAKQTYIAAGQAAQPGANVNEQLYQTLYDDFVPVAPMATKAFIGAPGRWNGRAPTAAEINANPSAYECVPAVAWGLGYWVMSSDGLPFCFSDNAPLGPFAIGAYYTPGLITGINPPDGGPVNFYQLQAMNVPPGETGPWAPGSAILFGVTGYDFAYWDGSAWIPGRVPAVALGVAGTPGAWVNGPAPTRAELIAGGYGSYPAQPDELWLGGQCVRTTDLWAAYFQGAGTWAFYYAAQDAPAYVNAPPDWVPTRAQLSALPVQPADDGALTPWLGGNYVACEDGPAYWDGAQWLAGVAPTVAYESVILADNPTNYWRLGETSGAAAVDVVGGNNGVIAGGVTLNQPGAVAGDPAMGFDGATGKITTPVNVVTPLLCSIEAWFKCSNVDDASYRVIVTNRDLTADPSLFVSINSNKVYVYVAPSALISVRAVTDGLWHHVVFVSDGANGWLYLDGVLDNTSAALPRVMTAHPAGIGYDIKNNGYFFIGLLDEVAIYPYALTAPQIAAHFAARGL